MAKSSAPSGLTLTRNNGTFTASWKIPSGGYADGQAMQYKTNGSWTKLSIGVKTTSKALANTAASNFYPNSGKKKLSSVQFRVQGNRGKYKSGRKTINPGVSAWSTKAFNIVPPRIPALTVENGEWPQTKFKWNVTVAANDAYWFTRVQYQSVLVRDSNETDGSKINWNSTIGTRYNTTNANAAYTITITEDSSQLADGHSYTRWFRARAQGPGGDSAWRYAKRVYAMSNQATITDYEVNSNSEASGYTVKVWFNSPFSASRPIGTVETQYAIATPDAGLTCPDGANWVTANTGLAKDGTGGAVFSVDSLVSADQCLFVRINTIYDERTTYGAPVVVDVGKLATPTGLTVTTDATQYTATVTATNASSVSDSFLVVRYFTAEDPDGFDIGIIEHGQTSVIVQCPEWSSTSNIVFGVYAAVGEYVETSQESGVTSYAVTAQMTSDIQKSGGTVPVAPSNVSAFITNVPGTIRVLWDWSWSDADSAELSWSDHEDAWESTAEPQTYTVSKMHASAWNISGLITGIKWYVRVRLVNTTGNSTTYGAYSDIIEVNLSSAPLVPVLTLSDAVITDDGQVTATWAYSTTDGTSQAFAVVAEATTVEGETAYSTIGEVQSAQHLTIDAAEAGWQSGETHLIAVRVVSGSGLESDGWSEPVAVTIAEPVTCQITNTSLETVTIETTDEEGQTVTRTALSLTEMPLSVTVTGADTTGLTTVLIERAASYHVDRPDETDLNGFEGEVIAQLSQVGAATMSIDLADLIGRLDDEAAYRIVATVQDGLGQSATASLDFEVHWSHQAETPTATVEVDAIKRVAFLTPIAPDGAENTDVCDIYRLSVDKPELIYSGATFGAKYVDPFPTIGEFGGHRFVTRTANGDYITADNEFAWYDTGYDEGDQINTRYNIIDFGDGQVLLEYNVDLSSAWAKSFIQTEYLGGSIQGDWNQAVARTASVSFVAIPDKDQDVIQAMRRLAAYSGICHIRTKDGSSYPADIQVNETYNYASGVRTSEFSLSITKVDQEELDGITYAEWIETQQEVLE